MHIMMQHVFGGKNLFGAKKIQPKEITQEKYRKKLIIISTIYFLKRSSFNSTLEYFKTIN